MSTPTTDTSARCKSCGVTKAVDATHWYMKDGRYLQPCRPCRLHDQSNRYARERASRGPACPYCREVLSKPGRVHGHGLCGRICSNPDCGKPLPMRCFAGPSGTAERCNNCRESAREAKALEFHK